MLIAEPTCAFNASPNIWPEGKTTFLVNFELSDPDQELRAEFQQAFVDALNAWTNQTAFEFEIDTNSIAEPCVNPASDPNNGVRFDLDSCGDGYGATTLAVQTAFFSNGVRVRTGITFNDNKEWAVFSEPFGIGLNTGKNDFYRVALHELGHSMGLGHPDGSARAIMEPSISELRAIQADDQAGAATMYDADNDGVGLSVDNCPATSNGAQTDTDQDGAGDVCDDDIDGDGVFDTATVDQQNGVSSLSNSFYLLGESNDAFAQTFTVGVAGQLQAVQLPIYCPSGDLLVQIRELTGANPSMVVIDSRSYSNGFTRTNEGFIIIGLNDEDINAGDQFAITVDSSGVCHWTTTEQTYAAGTGRFSNDRNSWFALGEDLPFATVVLPPSFDNCPITVNPDQLDSDNDGQGDACEDDDMDGVFNGVDNCPDSANPEQANFDADADGDECDNDIDGDGAPNGADTDSMDPLVCSDDDMDTCDDCSQGQYNPAMDGADSNSNGICDRTDTDDDGDGISDAQDNCPGVANPNQSDVDANMVGDACEPSLCFPVVTSAGKVALVCL